MGMGARVPALLSQVMHVLVLTTKHVCGPAETEQNLSLNNATTTIVWTETGAALYVSLNRTLLAM